MGRVLVAAVLLAACAGEGGPISIAIAGLPDAKETLPEIPEIRQGTTVQYQLRVTSHHLGRVRLQARLEPPVPDGMNVLLKGETDVRPKGDAVAHLVFDYPKSPGAYRGRVTLLSEDLPGWTRTYAFSGNVVVKPLEGAHIALDPAGGLDLGKLGPGERREFQFAVKSVGTSNLALADWNAEGGGSVALRGLRSGETVVPGGALQVSGRLEAPKAGGAFRHSVTIVSNDKNDPRKVFSLTGEVILPYSIAPPRLVATDAVRAQEPLFAATITAAGETAPFTVKEVLGSSAYLDVVPGGVSTAASEQTVQLRLRKDAPLGRWITTLRFRLEPGDVEIEWPVDLLVQPTIVAQPSRLRFGRSPAGAVKPVEVRLAALTPRDFQVTDVSFPHFLDVEYVRAPGLSWRVKVSVKPDAPSGHHDSEIRVSTDDPDTPGILIPVSIEIIGS
ncbi:MAG: hypothetical protein ACREID_00405 [Planctomycetota bacterium]